MYLDHNLIAKIAHVLDMVDSSAMLLDAAGNCVLPEGDTRHFVLPDVVRQNPTTPLVYGSITLMGTDANQPYYICLHGDSAEIRKCAVLCAEMINMLFRSDMGQTNREQSLRMMLRGDIEGADFEALAAEHGIVMLQNRCVLYLYFPEIEAEAAKAILSNINDNEADILVEVGRHSVVLLKALEEEYNFSEIEELASAIENTLLTESGNSVYIGISDPKKELTAITEAYEESHTAINVGRAYHPDKHVFAFRNLMLERFLSEVSAEMSRNYNALIFNRKTARLFNDEMIHTIETFFDNSLNLSETARKLYIHRNTLVYRLEKVQRAIGLDLRVFDDAVTFKMMLLLGKNTNNRKART